MIDSRTEPGDDEDELSLLGAGSEFELGGLGGFFAAQYGETERDRTALENGFESELVGAIAGLDYAFSDYFIAGVAVGYSDDDTRFDGGAGTLESRGLSGMLFATYAPIENAYIGAILGYTDLDFDATRVATFGGFTSNLVSEPEGEQLLAGLFGGYDTYIDAVDLGAFFKLDYTATDIDGFAETDLTGPGLALVFPDQSVKTLTSTLGLRISVSSEYEWGILTPYVEGSWLHEFKNDSRRIHTTLVVDSTNIFTIFTDNPDRSFGIGTIGVVAHAGDGVSLFFDYERMFGHSFFDAWSVSGGVSVEF